MTYTASDFDYHLPQELIAKFPAEQRSGSRLLVCSEDGSVQHQQFTDLPQWLRAGDLVVFNNTRVIPARLYGNKATGGRVECLVERVVAEHEAWVHLKSSKSPQTGAKLSFADGALAATVVGRVGALFHLLFAGNDTLLEQLERHGLMPLPPYIDRETTAEDRERYQTVYAREPGAVAAPTAGLHFDNSVLNALHKMGVSTAEITLHVGAGTFQPLRTESLTEHEMHAERVVVSQNVWDSIAQAKAVGGRVIAVGTTVVRALEAAAAQGINAPYAGDTQLFITPGYQFQVVDLLLTNFHLPKSTLIMLVAALGGYERVMAAYKAAVANEYRFYSYGDAMLVIP